ncbi:MAG: FtsQ-type POTRA domain-containing protein [Nitrospirae bacterium]|nr:FtsQ-type POTRA domain-containing protein [Nitrospirota bacterium]
MYFSQYRSHKKPFIKKRNGLKKNPGRLFGGVIRFLKLAVIIASLVPALYLMDKGYGFISQSHILHQADNFLKVRSVKIKGNRFVPAEELAPYLGKIEGRNIFRIDIRDIANGVKRHPWVKEVSIRRELPGTLWVDISERTPAVYVNNNGSLYLADEEGMILGDKTENALILPVVYGIDLPKGNAGNKSPVQGLSAAIEVKRELSSLPWIDLSTTGIEVEERGQIILHLKGYRIRLGRGGYREKLKRFNEIAKNLEEKGIPYKEIDLRFDNQVIVRTVKVI